MAGTLRDVPGYEEVPPTKLSVAARSGCPALRVLTRWSGSRCARRRQEPRRIRGGIDEARGEQVEGQELEEDRQQQHPARGREDGESGDRLRQIDELLADLALLLGGEGSSGARLGEELGELPGLADLLQDAIEVV